MLNIKYLQCFGLCLCLFLASCNTVEVNSVDTTAHAIKKVTILVNSDVVVKDFVRVLEKRIIFHGMSCYVSRDNSDKDNGYVVTYNARQSSDPTLFFTNAELKLSFNGNVIANAIYKMPNSKNANKFDNTEMIMNPIIDELFAYPKE